jgi:hypothetical protein
MVAIPTTIIHVLPYPADKSQLVQRHGNQLAKAVSQCLPASALLAQAPKVRFLLAPRVKHLLLGLQHPSVLQLPLQKEKLLAKMKPVLLHLAV